MKKEIVLAMAMLSVSGAVVERNMVTTETLNVRNDEGEVIERLDKGESIVVKEKQEYWTKIQTASGSIGWVNSDYLKKDENKSEAKIEYKEAYINMQYGANIKSESNEASKLVGIAKYNEKVIILEEGSNYTKVRLDNGEEGWVITQALSNTVSEEDSSQKIIKDEEDITQEIKKDEEQNGQELEKINEQESIEKIDIDMESIARTSVARVRVNVKSNLNVRSHPNINSAILTTLKSGTVVERTGASNGWVRLKLSNGKSGWVLGKYVSSTSSSASSGVKVKINYRGTLIVRSGPSSSRSILDRVSGGSTVYRTGSSGDWIRIRLSNGKVGWVQKQYITTSRLTPNPGYLKYKVNVSGSLNVRQYASLQAPIVSKLGGGNIIERLGISGDWMKVKYNGRIGWVSSRYLTLVSSDRTQSSLIGIAKSKLGCKYRWGATGPNEFDCSGFTQWVFARAGKSIPRVSRDQASKGTAVSRSNLRAGDLVCFATGETSTVSHVGIYLGNNQFIHASGSKSNPRSVMISNMSGYYDKAFKCARRY